MIDFTRTFLREGKRLFGQPRPTISLATFGKHPGWDDHMDAIGLDTESLLLAKQILYVEGIGGLIGSGEWDKLSESERLADFGHVFLWEREGAFLLGRVWPSQDGKGRAKFPMLVCAHCRGVSVDAALTEFLPIFEHFEQACRAGRTAEDVRQAYARALEQLGALTFGEAADAARPPALTGQFVRRMAPNDEALPRVVYALQNQFPPPPSWFSPGEESETKPASIRLPATAGMLRESLSYWNRFLRAIYGARSPLLMTMPLSQPWLDVTIGKPGRTDWYRLRATPEAVAVTSEVNYPIDEKFRTENAAVISALHDGRDFSKSLRFGKPKP